MSETTTVDTTATPATPTSPAIPQFVKTDFTDKDQTFKLPAAIVFAIQSARPELLNLYLRDLFDGKGINSVEEARETVTELVKLVGVYIDDINKFKGKLSDVESKLDDLRDRQKSINKELTDARDSVESALSSVTSSFDDIDTENDQLDSDLDDLENTLQDD